MSTNAAETHRGAAGLRHQIAVGVDGSECALRALNWAAAQAVRTGTRLKIVTAYGPGYVLVPPSAAQRVMRRIISQAKAEVRRSAPDAVVVTEAYEGTPEHALVKESAEADLLVVGSRGLGGFKGLLLGSVSRVCVHQAQCPVVVVGSAERGGTEKQNRAHAQGATATTEEPPHHRATGAPLLHRIAVGVDGSPSSIGALQWAAVQAELTGDQLHAVISWESPVGFGWAPIPDNYDPVRDSHQILDEALRPVRAAHPGLSIEETVQEGPPAPLLVEAACDADLLVVGSRGRGDLAGMLLGSVGEYCVTHAPCPVLVVRDGTRALIADS